MTNANPSTSQALIGKPMARGRVVRGGGVVDLDTVP
jgi:hypothetical protein